MAERLASDLVNRSLVIFRDLARGGMPPRIAAPSTPRGRTVAVFGTGDIVYPKKNSRLTEQMRALGGALISEFPMSTFAAPQNFPIRNRNSSGISIGVRVVEAAELQRYQDYVALRSGTESRGVRRLPATLPTRVPGNRTP